MNKAAKNCASPFVDSVKMYKTGAAVHNNQSAWSFGVFSQVLKMKARIWLVAVHSCSNISKCSSVFCFMIGFQYIFFQFYLCFSYGNLQEEIFSVQIMCLPIRSHLEYIILLTLEWFQNYWGNGNFCSKNEKLFSSVIKLKTPYWRSGSNLLVTAKYALVLLS